MHELIPRLDDEQQALVGYELEKLFAFQDKPLSKEKRAILLQELTSFGLPFKAVVKGIRKLMTEDLRSIKLSAIRDAAFEFTEHEEQTVICTDCNRSGLIVMRDPDYRSCALACRCVYGEQKARAMGLMRWNGSASQMGNGGRALCTA